MAMGVPVVASRAGPIPEVVGEAAELVDPLDVKDIARGLASVLLDSERSQTLIRRGFERSSEFSWDESARLTFAAIRAVLP
jgi:glycosyltransferase involved in cell wall biosynthesis